ALFYLVAGDRTQAELLYRDVLQQTPKDLVALNNLATLLGNTPDTVDEAERHVNVAIESHGQLSDLLDTKAMIRLRQGDFGGAVELLQQATDLSLFPNPLHEFHLAAALLRFGQLEKAKERFAFATKNGLRQQLLTSGDKQLLGEVEATLAP
ncbi:MAG: hypothetical protein KDB14_28020, partial [Planctomycetales bacterium]|nr:hypothetical protein [Planctomycetales bacterium]